MTGKWCVCMFTGAVIACAVSGCREKEIRVTEVTLNRPVLILAAGETDTVAASVAPANASDLTVVWTSSNEDVATVAGGVVTAHANGVATVTASAKSGGVMAVCKVTVAEYMRMTSALQGEMVLAMTGMGTATIDWGDGSAGETLELAETFTRPEDFLTATWFSETAHRYRHNYAGTGSRTVKIAGENITRLYCIDNELSELDVSSNTALVELYCRNNLLTELDVSSNTALVILRCSYNQLSSLDVSSNTALVILRCNHNQFTAFDVSSNTAMRLLDCDANHIGKLDVSNNPALIRLDCSSNNIGELDVSNNTALRELYCSGNRLTSLDVSNNVVLVELYCRSNLLDVDHLEALFRSLHNNIAEGEKTVYIEDNPGTGACNLKIANDRFWAVK